MKKAKKQFSHLNAKGEAAMVDVSAKPALLRTATARGEIQLQAGTLKAIADREIPKGDVFAVARVAGIMAAKKTGELIPLCHPLPLTHCEVNFETAKKRSAIVITATARTVAGTGIEMEALMAVSVAALTIYDMCKAVDKGMNISDVTLVSKTKEPLHTK